MATRSSSAAIQEELGRPADAAAKTLGIRTTDVVKVANRLKRGLPYEALQRLRRRSGLSLEAIETVLQIPRRTLARRKAQGKLTPQESDRLYRLALIFEKAAALFEGDLNAARNWLLAPNKALADQAPLQTAETEIGAREVEDLIGRLEHGVFA